MSDRQEPLPGISVTTGRRAVRISSERPLTVLGSAVVGGGYGSTREILNLHVDLQYDGDPQDDLATAAAELGVAEPFVGLMTAAYTEFARCAVESLGSLSVAAVVTLGLSNPAAAGVTPPIRPAREDDVPAPAPGTINTVLLVDGRLAPAAMVNLVITATEAKTMSLIEWDVRTVDDDAASGTSTDTVVVACTGHGEELSYAGPATPVGWLAARTVRAAMNAICADKIERDGGRCGW